LPKRSRIRIRGGFEEGYGQFKIGGILRQARDSSGLKQQILDNGTFDKEIELILAIVLCRNGFQKKG